jgi:hypothetical protein
VRTAATIGFICVVAAAALYLAQRPTVIKGSVMAADMLDRLPKDKAKHFKITCDDVPISVAGATYDCRIVADDGSTATYKYHLDRDGRTTSDLLASTPPTRGFGRE